MTTLKALTIVAALLAGGTSLAMAQNGPATGGEPPVAGGAGGNAAVPGPGYYGYYLGAPGYFGAPDYLAAPGFAVAPGFTAQPEYAQPIQESGPAAAPRRVATTPHRRMYMYAPAHRSNHTHKITPATNGGY
jgi:hypothetical protein